MTREEVLVDELKRKLPEMTCAELNEVRDQINLLGMQNREAIMRRRKAAEGRLPDSSIKRVDLDHTVPLSPWQRTSRLQKIFYLTERQYKRYKKVIPASALSWWLQEEKTVGYRGKVFDSEPTQFRWNGREAVSLQKTGMRPLLRSAVRPARWCIPATLWSTIHRSTAIRSI